MLKFFICDDELQSLKILYKNLQRIIEENNIDGRIILQSQKPKDILEEVKKVHNTARDCNIYLLDVDLSNALNGLELARRIRQIDPIGYLIFVTAHIEYEMSVYKNFLKAFAYIIKPMQLDDFSKTVLSAVKDFERIYQKYNEIDNDRILIKSGYRTYYINVNDIILLERLNRKTNIYTESGSYNTVNSLSDYGKSLYKFSNIKKVHKSYIINEEAIKEIDFKKKQIIMKNGMIVPIARTQKAKLRKDIIKK